MTVNEYTKQPITIEAMQWDGTPEGAGPIINWVLENGVARYQCLESEPPGCEGKPHAIRIKTLEGDMDAKAGWWIIRGVIGEYYPCDPEVFAQTYATGGKSQVSDGHHTFEELYYYRMLYNAQAALAWLAAGIKVEKSWNHHDGEPCFGGGMFVVQAELPTGQVSNHYKAEYWDLFDVPEVWLPAVYDGHTPAIAAERMRDYLVSLQTG